MAFGYIYVIRQLDSKYMFSTPARDGCSYKIGKTKERSPRFKAISLLLPHPTEFIVSIPASMAWGEQYLHEKLTNARMHGEWFKLRRFQLLWLVGIGNPHAYDLSPEHQISLDALYAYYEEYCGRDPE